MPLSLGEILILAVVQGFTEFLPVSSSGHLVVLSGVDDARGDPSELDVADLNVVLHIGTLFSILVFYWHRIWRLVGEDRRVIPLLIVGTIPAVVLGLGIKLTCEELVESPLLAGVMLPVTGVMLLWATRHMEGKGHYTELSARQAFCDRAVPERGDSAGPVAQRHDHLQRLESGPGARIGSHLFVPAGHPGDRRCRAADHDLAGHQGGRHDHALAASADGGHRLFCRRAVCATLADPMAGAWAFAAVCLVVHPAGGRSTGLADLAEWPPAVT